MAGYSDDEIETTVSGFIKSDVTVRRDPLGPTDLGAKYSEAVEFLSAILVSNPNAIFYLIYLSTNRLNVLVNTLIEDTDDLLEAISEMGARTKEITRTSLLGDAAAALLSIDSILTNNNAVSGSGVNTYRSLINQFRDVSLAPNIRKQGQIVRPPQKARSDSVTLLSSLATNWAAAIESVDKIDSMVDQFNSLNLPAITLQQSVRKVRTDTVALQALFEDPTTSKDTKIASAKDAYLRLASGSAVIKNNSNIVDPTAPRLKSSTTTKARAAIPVSGSIGELTAAEVTSSRSAPYDIETGTNDEIKIAEDGGFETTYTIPTDTQPTVTSFVVETYDIHSASTAQLTGSNVGPFAIPGVGNIFKVLVNGVLFSGAITPGGAVSTATVITDILSIPGLSAVLSVTDSGGAVQLSALVSGSTQILIGEEDPYLTPINGPLGFTGGQEDTGLNANNRIQIDGLSPDVSLTDGAARTAVQVASDINTWVTANYVGQYSATDAGGYVEITKTKSGAQKLVLTANGVNAAVILAAYQTLGITEGQQDTSAAVTAAEIAKVINDVGLVLATPVKTVFEEGNDGEVDTATTFKASPGAIDLSENHVGDMLKLRNGDNAGDYRIVSITTGASDVITVEAAKPFNTSVANTTDQSWIIIREQIQIESIATDLSTELVVGVGNANAEVGLTSATTKGLTTGLRVATGNVDQSFVRADVSVGDIVQIPGEPDRTVLEVSDDKQLEVSPALSTDANALYNFTIYSADALEHAELSTGLASWISRRKSSSFANDTNELDRVMNRLINNANPSAALKGAATTTVDRFKELLTFTAPPGLSELLTGYVIRIIPRMDNSLKMLIERGFDRGVDTLLNGDITSFFGYDKDDASRSAFLLKAIREIAREDIPLSKQTEDAEDIQHDPSVIVETDPGLDFSDGDDETEDLLGEEPTFSEDDPFADTILRETY